jgi:hypothetical protein
MLADEGTAWGRMMRTHHHGAPRGDLLGGGGRPLHPLGSGEGVDGLDRGQARRPVVAQLDAARGLRAPTGQGGSARTSAPRCYRGRCGRRSLCPLCSLCPIRAPLCGPAAGAYLGGVDQLVDRAGDARLCRRPEGPLVPRHCRCTLRYALGRGGGGTGGGQHLDVALQPAREHQRVVGRLADRAGDVAAPLAPPRSLRAPY